MRKPPPLTDRTLVVDLPDSPNKNLIQLHLFYDYSSLLCLARSIPGKGTDLMRPPVIESSHGQNRKIVLLCRIAEFARGFRQFLHECKEVYPCPTPSHAFEYLLWILQKLVLVSVNAGNPDQLPFDFNSPAANYHGWVLPFSSFLPLVSLPAFALWHCERGRNGNISCKLENLAFHQELVLVCVHGMRFYLHYVFMGERENLLQTIARFEWWQ